MVIKKNFNKAPFIDNPYKEKYYIDVNFKLISVYEKIQNKKFFSFLDKNKNNKYKFIGSKIYEISDTGLKDIDKLKNEIFSNDSVLMYYELSNLNTLYNIIDKLCESKIIDKGEFLNFLYSKDLDIEKLSLLMKEKCNLEYKEKLERNKRSKIAEVTGYLSGSFLKKQIQLTKEPVRVMKNIINEIIDSK